MRRVVERRHVLQQQAGQHELLERARKVRALVGEQPDRLGERQHGAQQPPRVEAALVRQDGERRVGERAVDAAGLPRQVVEELSKPAAVRRGARLALDGRREAQRVRREVRAAVAREDGLPREQHDLGVGVGVLGEEPQVGEVGGEHIGPVPAVGERPRVERHVGARERAVGRAGALADVQHDRAANVLLRARDGQVDERRRSKPAERAKGRRHRQRHTAPSNKGAAPR